MDTLTRNNVNSDNVFVGVDTHKDSHTAVIVDYYGVKLDTLVIDTNTKGFKYLDEWASEHGSIRSFGIEGTGCYGKNLAEFLSNRNYQVIEIDRVNKQHRRRHGKTDETDAHAAAKAVASGQQTKQFKQTSGDTEIVRVIQLSRNSAVKTRTQVTCQIKSLLVTAPETIRKELSGLTTLKLVSRAANWRPANHLLSVTGATKHAIKTLAKRWLSLNDEIKQHDQDLKQILEKKAPKLLKLQGVGTDVAAKLVLAAGSNPQRLKTEAAFAALCGVSPVDCSSGKQQRHRLNQGGNRQANNALHTIAITRMNHDPQTKKYVTKKMSEGKTRKETIRSLKRHIARQIYKQLKQLT